MEGFSVNVCHGATETTAATVHGLELSNDFIDSDQVARIAVALKNKWNHPECRTELLLNISSVDILRKGLPKIPTGSPIWNLGFSCETKAAGGGVTEIGADAVVDARTGTIVNELSPDSGD